MDIEQIRRDIANKGSEVMALLTALSDVRKTMNKLEKTESRLRNELNEMHKDIDDSLDKGD